MDEVKQHGSVARAKGPMFVRYGRMTFTAIEFRGSAVVGQELG